MTFGQHLQGCLEASWPGPSLDAFSCYWLQLLVPRCLVQFGFLSGYIGTASSCTIDTCALCSCKQMEALSQPAQPACKCGWQQCLHTASLCVLTVSFHGVVPWHSGCCAGWHMVQLALSALLGAHSLSGAGMCCATLAAAGRCRLSAGGWHCLGLGSCALTSSSKAVGAVSLHPAGATFQADDAWQPIPCTSRLKESASEHVVHNCIGMLPLQN